MNYIYTASKLATSTVERKLARITPLSMIACPFTVWTQDDTDMAFVTPTQTEYVKAYRSRANRATRKAMARENATALNVLPNGTLAA
jgi:hypothetical protein